MPFYFYFTYRDLHWYAVSHTESQEIFSPSLKIENAQELSRERKVSITDSDFFWFAMPHQLELQQAFKVTIYCTFDFTYFPFDSHYCDFNHGSAKHSLDYLYLLPAWLRYRGKVVYGPKDKPIQAKQSRLPFEMTLESRTPFEVFEAGFNYS